MTSDALARVLGLDAPALLDQRRHAELHRSL
jgi:hypothetical protein